MQSIFFYPHRNIACRTTDYKMYLPEIFIGNYLFFAYHTANLHKKPYISSAVTFFSQLTLTENIHSYLPIPNTHLTFLL